MSERDDVPDLEEVSANDRPLAIPDELPVLPLRDTVLFPNSFMIRNPFLEATLAGR